MRKKKQKSQKQSLVRIVKAKDKSLLKPLAASTSLAGQSAASAGAAKSK